MFVSNIIYFCVSKNRTLEKSRIIDWAKKIGFAGFLFFLIKGLVWLYVLYFLKSKL